ncbi:T9SS type A sorting domain-containing protein [candidate division WOR-3 bacterium]|nr:T9SS type A sorting domain-containing protein [candidate division WOR-3 bacterium]
MKGYKYFALGVIFTGVAVTYKDGTNLSNTSGVSCSFSYTARSVATDSKNRVHAIWKECPSESSVGKLYYRRSLDGGTIWEDTTRILFDSYHVGESSIATNNKDIVHIIGYGTSELHYTRSTDGGANWEPDTVIGTVGEAPSAISIATTGDSLVHIVWKEKEGSLYKFVYIRSCNNGLEWEPPVEVATARSISSPEGTFPPCAPIAPSDSLVHLVWHDIKDDSSGEIYYRRPIGETWEPAVRLTTDTLLSFFPSIASSGDFVYIGWVQGPWQDSLYKYYFKRSSNCGATWEDTVCLIQEVFVEMGMYGLVPQLAAKDEFVAVVWGTLVQDTMIIGLKYSTDRGLNWSAPTYMDTSFSMFPSLTIDDQHHIHIIWTLVVGGGYDIFHAKYSLVEVEEERNWELGTNNWELDVYPNPFKEKTVIRYSLNGNRTINDLRLTIHDLSGRLIREFTNLTNDQSMQVIWDGRDQSGNPVSGGIYFYTLTAGDYTKTRKMCLMR